MRKVFFMVGCLMLMIFSPVEAQLFKQYKNEIVSFDYFQFPIKQERKSEVTVELLEKNLLGAAANKVIKSDKIAGALTAKGGVLGDDVSESKTILIPAVFPTDGELHAEVKVSLEFKSKKTFSVPVVKHGFIKDGEEVEVLASFKVYNMPEKKVIYEHDQVWVHGYTGKSSSGAPVSGDALAAAKKRIAKSWATEQIKNLYGLRVRIAGLPVYLIKKLEKEEEDKAEAMQEQLMKLAVNFKGQKDKNYNAKLDQCIDFWNSQLKRYEPGTSKRKEALINDNNAWCLYYNIAFAYFLKSDKKNAKEYMAKASDLRKVKPKAIIGKDGEKKGEVATNFDPEEQHFLAEMENMIENYFSGVESMNPKFVALVNDSEKIKGLSRLGREWAGNIFLSQAFELDVPVNFVSDELKGQPKLVTGSVNDQVNYAVKKDLLYPLTHAYRVKAHNQDQSIKTKQKYSGIYLPKVVTPGFQGLVSGIEYKKVVNAEKSNEFTRSYLQYDYNGDVIITNITIKDKWSFVTFCDLKKDEALGVVETRARIIHDNLDVQSVELETTEIERDRTIGLVTAYLEKKVAPNEPLATTEVKRNTTSKKLKYSPADSKLVVENNGKAKTWKLVEKFDDKGNLNELNLGDYQVERSYTY
jgi:hypothetical protein